DLFRGWCGKCPANTPPQDPRLVPPLRVEPLRKELRAALAQDAVQDPLVGHGDADVADLGHGPASLARPVAQSRLRISERLTSTSASVTRPSRCMAASSLRARCTEPATGSMSLIRNGSGSSVGEAGAWAWAGSRVGGIGAAARFGIGAANDGFA